MPVSQRKLQANRLNAQKSTGPRTPEGKAVCSLNAITHGLRARHAVMLIEDRREFEALCRELHNEWQPMTPTESHMVEQMAVCRWKAARIEKLISSSSLQSAFMHLAFKDIRHRRAPNAKLFVPDLSHNLPEQKLQRMLDGLQRHQASLERSYFNAFQTLGLLQRQRQRKLERVEQARAQEEAIEKAVEKAMTAGAGAAGAGFAIAFEPEAGPENKPAARVTRYGNTWARKDSA